MEEKSISKKHQSGDSEFLASSPMKTTDQSRARQGTSPRRAYSAGARTLKFRMQQQKGEYSASVRATAASVSSQPTRSNRQQAGERSKNGGDDKKEQHWNTLIKDRNRINAQKSRKKQQEQLSRLEAENTRLSVSNEALRYHNRHLQDAISNIKEQQNAQTSAPSYHQTANLPSQQTAPCTLNQQPQPSSLMLASNDTTRIIPQALALTAAAFASTPELAALLQPRAVPSRGNTIIGFASPVTGASTSFARPELRPPQLFICCNEFGAFCTLDPAIQQLYQGDRHHPKCQNYRK